MFPLCKLTGNLHHGEQRQSKREKPARLYMLTTQGLNIDVTKANANTLTLSWYNIHHFYHPILSS